jgi:hypothetical protein
MRIGILLVFLSVTVTQSLSGADAKTAGCAALATAGSASVHASDATAAGRLRDLMRDSTIVREMLAYLDVAQVRLTIRSSASLMRDQRSGGLSRFFVDRGILQGYVEFDRAVQTESAQKIILAHEVGHAVEIATLPRHSTNALGNQLLAQIGQHVPWSSQLVIETRFAQNVDKLVSGELRYGAAPPGTLDRLARRHGLKLAPCATPAMNADQAAAARDKDH